MSLHGRHPQAWRAPPYLPPGCKIGQPAVVDLAMSFVRRRGSVVQAGAHVGVWPAALAPHFERVIAFEPLQHLWRCAVEAVRADNVLTMPCALSCQTGSVLMNPGNPATFTGSAAVGRAGIEVPAIRMDDLPAALLRDLGAIFLDIEGHELEALQGGPNTLRTWRPVVVVEQNAKSLRYRPAEAIADVLSPLGYSHVASLGSDLVFSAEPQP